MLIHHNQLRVNAELPDHIPDAAWAIYEAKGWAKGKHRDSDSDDRSRVPAVKVEKK